MSIWDYYVAAGLLIIVVHLTSALWFILVPFVIRRVRNKRKKRIGKAVVQRIDELLSPAVVASGALSPNEARAHLPKAPNQEPLSAHYKTVRVSPEQFYDITLGTCLDFRDDQPARHVYEYDPQLSVDPDTMVFICFWCMHRYPMSRAVYYGLVTGTITTPSSKEHIGRTVPTPGHSHGEDA